MRNNSKVFKARLFGTWLSRVVDTQSHRALADQHVVEDGWMMRREVEIFVVRPLRADETAATHAWRVLGKPSRKLGPGDRVVR